MTASKHHMLKEVGRNNESTLADEYRLLMREALKRPGVKEAMKVYGQYEQMVAEAHMYLGLIQTKESFSVSTSTS